MSSNEYSRDGIDGVDQLEQQYIIERASVEPETPDETSRLLGYSKRPFPKRVFILAVTLVGMCLFQLATAPAELDIVFRFICYFNDVAAEKCLADTLINQKVATFAAISTAITGVMALFVSTYLSMLSDRVGRRPIMLGSMALTTINQFLTWFLVFHYPNPPTYWILMIPKIIDTLGGTTQLLIQLAVAYLSDMISDARQKARLIALMEGSLFGTMATAPALGSIIIRKYDIQVLYICTFTGMSLIILVSALFLQESLSTYHKRRNSTNKRSVRKTFSILKFNHVEDNESRWNARLLLIWSLVGKSVIMSCAPIILLYPRRSFGWSAVEVGYFVTVLCATGTFWYLIGFPLLFSWISTIKKTHSDRLDILDTGFMRLSQLFAILGYIGFSRASSGKQYLLFCFVDGSAAIGRSVFTSVQMKYLPHGQYGSYMAAYNFVFSATTAVLPGIFLKIYTWSMTWHPSLPFELVAGTCTALLIGSFMLKPAR